MLVAKLRRGLSGTQGCESLNAVFAGAYQTYFLWKGSWRGPEVLVRLGCCEASGLCRASFVAVMETADLRNFDHPPFLRRLCRARLGCILFQGQMRSPTMVVAQVRSDNSPEMRFPENDDMIEAFPAYRSDYALHIRTLPRTVRRNDHFLNAESLHSIPNRQAVY